VVGQTELYHMEIHRNKEWASGLFRLSLKPWMRPERPKWFLTKLCTSVLGSTEVKKRNNIFSLIFKIFSRRNKFDLI
jgi:hypothetical protein